MRVTEQDLWIVARMVLKRHGDGAAAFAAGRVAALEKAGDIEGADIWTAVMGHLGQIASETPGIFE